MRVFPYDRVPDGSTVLVTNLFTNPRMVGSDQWYEYARFNTGDEPPVMEQPEDFRIRDLGTGESVMEFEMVATKIGEEGPTYLSGLASNVWPEGGTSLRILGDVPVRVGDQLDPYDPVPLPGVRVSAIPLGDPTTPAWLAGISEGVLWDTGKISWTAGQPEAQGSYGAILRTTGGTNPVSLYGSFRFTGTRFALMMTSWAETDVTVYVDHRAVTPTAYPTLTQGTGYQLVVIEGLGAGAHTVDFCIGWASNFLQILCEQPLSVEPGPQPAFRLGLLGDSYTDSGIQPYYGGLARELHRLTGWSIYQLGQGSTGYTNDGSSSGDPSKSVYGSPSRVAAANGAACDAVLIIGSVNDGAASPATVAQACEDLVQALHAPVIIAGVEPLSLPDDPGTAWDAVNDALMAMASWLVKTAGGGVIDWRAESWFTGTGSVSQPRGDGNQDLYVGDAAGTDTIHANIEGQMFLADRFVAAMTPMTLVRRTINDAEYATFPAATTGRTLVLRAESPSQFVLTTGAEWKRLHPDGDGIVRVSDAGTVLLSAGRWTDIGVFAGNYDGPVFDGGTPDDGDIFHQWSGSANSSTSTRSIRNFLSVSADDTPHTVIEVDDLDPGVAFITVWRDDGSRWVEVRAAVMVAVVGAWAGVDWECGFNRLTAYRVEQFDSGGLSLGFLPAVTVTLASDWTWVQNVLAPKDAVRVMFTSKALETVDRPYDAEIVYPRGASLGTVVGSARRGVTGVNLEMVTDTLTDADRVQALLGSPGNELPPVLCVRKGANEGSARIPHTMFVHTPSIVEVDFNVRYGGESVIHQAVGTEVRPPAKRIGTPLLTRADLSAAYATRAARSADNISRVATSRRWDLAGFASV